MKSGVYKSHARALLTRAEAIEDSKRPAYTIGNEDVLINFKTVAQRLGITTSQAWGVYALKHFDAINAWAKDPNIPQGEKLSGRFADAINYLKLGYAIYMESTIRKGEKQCQKQRKKEVTSV